MRLFFIYLKNTHVEVLGVDSMGALRGEILAWPQPQMKNIWHTEMRKVKIENDVTKLFLLIFSFFLSIWCLDHVKICSSMSLHTPEFDDVVYELTSFETGNLTIVSGYYLSVYVRVSYHQS